MHNQQQQRMDEVAQQFADAVVAAYRTTSGGTVAAQELGARLTEYFLNSVITRLHTQAEGTRQAAQQLVGQQQRAQEGTQELTQASTDTYLNLLNSIFSFYQGGTSRAKKRSEEAERRVEEAESGRSEAQRRAEEAEARAEEAEGRAEEAQRRAEEAESGRSEAESQGGDGLPLADYGSLNIGQISERLHVELS
jgi:uncharacterized phage infection (PIP) family protein YhgE